VRAPIEPGNPGWDPDQAGDRARTIGGALRGAGLVIILIAFLFVSQTFVSDDEPEPTTTSAPGPATVTAVDELQPVVATLDAPANVEYGPSAESRERVAGGAAIDVFVGATADAQSLVAEERCGPLAPVTTGPAAYSACLVIRSGARVESGRAFIDDLTGLTGRAALLDAGFELPPR
jgi:hypothetical protein